MMFRENSKSVFRRGLYLLCFAALIASQSPALAQDVTFEVYPGGAEMHVGSGSNDAFSPLGYADQTIDITNKSTQGVLVLKATADGRKPWVETFRSRESGWDFPRKIYLHPENPALYAVDAVRLYPIPTFLVLGLLGSFAAYYLKKRKETKAADQTELAFENLGANMRRRFGNYIAYKELGRGGMGVVFLAVPEDKVTEDEIVAIKILGKEITDSAIADDEDAEGPTEEDVARFRREIKILKSLSHPNILDVIDWGLDEDDQYLVTERLRGQELEDYLLAQGSLPIEEIEHKFSQLAHGLQYVHDSGVLHRDLKPQNIFLTESGKLKILDFGLARSKDQSRALTVQGRPFGTIDYMSPETFLGQSAEPSTDQYALGVILFKMFSTSLPMIAKFEGPNESWSNFHEMATKERATLQSVCPDVPDEIAAVVDRMIHVDAPCRFPSVKDAFEAFEHAMTTADQKELKSV